MQHHLSLKPYNTFGIDAIVENFIAITEPAQLAGIGAISGAKHVLGGGSNILLTGDVKGIVLLNKIKGITQLKEDADYVWLSVGAGEVWHELVLHTVSLGLGGMENLALIPGTVGASPMQNIGAYGAEARDVIDSVTFWHWQECNFVTFTNAECRFGYRDSIFKNELKGKVFITSVVYKLRKHPVFNTSYGAIEQELAHMNVTQLSLKAIAQAVINIRTSKLPDPAVIGNAGSFFKNPTVPVAQFDKLMDRYPGLPCYRVSEHEVKIPAGWLIEQCGWKGYRHGAIGVHARQALVLVNYGGASGAEIWQLSGEIVASVEKKFGIELEREVQVW